MDLPYAGEVLHLEITDFPRRSRAAWNSARRVRGFTASRGRSLATCRA